VWLVDFFAIQDGKISGLARAGESDMADRLRDENNKVPRFLWSNCKFICDTAL